MRRSLVPLLMLLFSLAAAASAQTPTPVTESVTMVNGQFMTRTAIDSPVGKATVDEVAARIMMFDRDHDGQIVKDELIERMQDLVTRGDSNGDGALDGGEIHMLAMSPATASVQGFPGHGGYSFSDQPGLSSRLHFEGALDDLRLASETRDEALAIVQTFVESHEASVSANLLKEMETVLTPEQLAEFTKALGNQSQVRVFRAGNDSTPMVFFMGTDLGRIIQKYKLWPEQSRVALAAIEQFNARFRPDAAEKSALVERMKEVLSDDERANFRAALDRRPLTKGGVAMTK